MMLHTKYLSFRPCGFRQEDFCHVSPYISPCNTCDPWAGPFLAAGALFEQSW